VLQARDGETRNSAKDAGRGHGEEAAISAPDTERSSLAASGVRGCPSRKGHLVLSTYETCETAEGYKVDVMQLPQMQRGGTGVQALEPFQEPRRKDHSVKLQARVYLMDETIKDAL
jgi:hypothetical protein